MPDGLSAAIASILIAAIGITVKRLRQSTKEERPIFENGEREAVRKALSMLGAASSEYRDRIAVLEGKLDMEAAAARREHRNLEERITDLEMRVSHLRKQSPT